MKNKKVSIIVISAILLVVVIGLAVYFLVIKPQSASASSGNTKDNGNVAGQNFGGGNFANFQNITGKILSVSSTDMIVDSGSSQSDVVWDTSTRVTGTVSSDQTTVLAIGNTVSIKFNDVNGTKQASIISKVDLSAFMPNGTLSPNNGPNGGGGRRGNGTQGGGTGNSNGGNTNRIARPTTRTSYTGTITAINGSTLTISENGFGGFGRGGVPDSTLTPTPTPTSIDFDISNATYTVTVVKSITDIKVGDSVQISGTVQTNKQVMARNITIS